MNKKAMNPPSTMVVIIIGIVLLAIILGLIFFFGSSVSDSNSFKFATSWTEGFRW